MQLHSLGYRTDLIFIAFDGEIIDRGDYLVAHSAANPTFYWGNFLLFARPPRPGDFERWPALFAQEIGTPPQMLHQTFGWDSPTGEMGEIQPFLEAGFRLNHFVVLTARQVQPPPRPASDITIRPLTSEVDWAEALENQIRCREPGHDEAEFRVFKARQMSRYQMMSRAGLGAWFGAFLGNRLVADLGIFRDRDIGRFQSVVTHPDFRRRGICGTLVYQAAQHAFTHWGLQTLVMVADFDSAPARIYQSVGFRPVEQQAGLERW